MLNKGHCWAFESIQFNQMECGHTPKISNPKQKVIYPPFEYPITEWLELSGFSSFCNYQYYRQGIRFSNAAGERRIGYFNFYGTAERTSRQDAKCYAPYIPRDITFRRVDGAQDPLKWEINVIDGKGNSFTDHGLEQPTFTCQCGDCAADCVRCESYKYPGYQCIPCSQFKSEISAMRSIIRRING